MRRSVRLAIAAAGTVALLALSACGGGSDGGAATNGSGGKEPIKVGVAVAQTGIYSFAGVPSKQGAELAVEQVNQQGGINGRKVELINGDNGSDQQQTKTLMTKYAADSDVMAVLGPSSSAVSPAIAPVVKDLKIPAIAPTVVTPQWTTGNPYGFKMGTNPDAVGLKLCEVVKTLGLKRIAIIVTRDNAGQVGYKDTAVKCMPGSGAEVVTVQTVTDATDDYSSFISNIKASNPDGIFTLLSGERSAQFEVQARAAGIPTSIGFFGPNTVTGADFIKIGKASVEGTVGVTEYFPGTPNDVNKKFVKAYNKKYGNDPDNYAAQGYASMTVVLEAIKKAAPDITRDKVRDGMASVANQPTVMGEGTLSIDKHHAPLYGLVTVQVKNGKLALYKAGS